MGKLFTPEELEELRRADAEMENSFVMTAEEREISNERDLSIKLERRSPKNKRTAESKLSYYLRHREELLQKQRAYQEANKERLSQAHRLYYQKHREYLIERQRAYDAAHREEIAERRKSYYQKNREKILAKACEYRNMKREQVV